MSNGTEVEKHNGSELQREEPKTILQVIAQAAADPRVDTNKMKELLEMQRQIRKDEAEIAFNAALAALMRELPRIEKNGAIMDSGGTKVRSRWARYEDIDRVVRPLLAQHGFAVSFDTNEDVAKSMRITGTLSHEMGHSRQSHITIPIAGPPGTSSAQAVGSTASYGKRYILVNMLNIVTIGEDDDGQGGNKKISEDQAMTLHTLLKDSNSNVPKFLEILGAETVEAILDRDFQRAMSMVQDKMRKQGGR